MEAHHMDRHSPQMTMSCQLKQPLSQTCSNQSALCKVPVPCPAAVEVVGERVLQAVRTRQRLQPQLLEEASLLLAQLSKPWPTRRRMTYALCPQECFLHLDLHPYCYCTGHVPARQGATMVLEGTWGAAMNFVAFMQVCSRLQADCDHL